MLKTSATRGIRGLDDEDALIPRVADVLLRRVRRPPFWTWPALGGYPPLALESALAGKCLPLKENNTFYKKHAVVATLVVFSRLGSNLALLLARLGSSWVPLGRLLGGTCLAQSSSWLILARLANSWAPLGRHQPRIKLFFSQPHVFTTHRSHTSSPYSADVDGRGRFRARG